MQMFELELTKFEFPQDLPNQKANFRFVVDLRFIDNEDRFSTEHAVMPGLDTFWECSADRRNAPNYVVRRATGVNSPNSTVISSTRGTGRVGPDAWICGSKIFKTI